ncbi:MAG: flagellar brake protein [Candidatus Omnitrophota bacterium]
MSTKDQDKKGYSFLLDPAAPPPFYVGQSLNLQTTADKYKKNRFPVSLAGWVRPHLLVVYHNNYDTGILAIPTGTELIVRYIHEGQIYGFVTKLFHKQTEPMPFWFFEYPLEIEVINLRQSSRIPITLEVTTPEGEVYFTRDISKEGASLRLTAMSNMVPRKVGDTIALNFSLPDGVRVENLKALIMRQYSEQNLNLLGVKFDESCVREREIISHYVGKLEKDFFTGMASSSLWEATF